MRNPQECWKLILTVRDRNHPNRENARKRLQFLGLNPDKISFLWNISYLRPNFFRHFSIDIMHLWELGVCNLMFTWIAVQYPDLVGRINLAVADFKNNAELPSKLRYLGYLYAPTGAISADMTASTMHDLIAHAPELLGPTLQEAGEHVVELLRCSRRLQTLLYGYLYTEDDLKYLRDTIAEWKESMTTIFPPGGLFSYDRPNWSARAYQPLIIFFILTTFSFSNLKLVYIAPS